MRKRTRAREIALQGLYQLDIRSAESWTEVEGFVRERAGPDEELFGFAALLVRGVRERADEIDSIIRPAAENWNLERMARIDRNILRMAVYEMLHEPEIPAKVSINEAIEMGKRYSTGQSGSFINGILDRIRRERQL